MGSMHDRTDSRPAGLDWQAIDTVLLDMDGTLLDLGFDNWFWQRHVPEAYARTHRLEPAAAAELLSPRFRAAQGSLAWYCIDHWSRELSLDIGHLKHAARERVRFLPGAAEFLGWLGARGKRRILVTNAHPRTLAIKDEWVSLRPLLEQMHSSHSYGLPKEDPEFWPRLAGVVDFDPRRTLFIDDSLPVLRAARHYGIAHIVAVRHPELGGPPRSTEDFAAVDAIGDLVGADPR
jgi:5'-nucleotidase